MVTIEQGFAGAYQSSVFFGEELQIEQGDVDKALQNSEFTIKATYITQLEQFIELCRR